jgi:hypothetical protein
MREAGDTHEQLLDRDSMSSKSDADTLSVLRPGGRSHHLVVRNARFVGTPQNFRKP